MTTAKTADECHGFTSRVEPCPAMQPVASTFRQWYYCERPRGHEGQHAAGSLRWGRVA